MDFAKLSSKVYSGYAKAAKRIGFDSEVYRTASLTSPIDVANKIHTAFKVSVAPDFSFERYNKHQKPDWILMCDGNLVEIGDWIDGGSNGLFYVADKQPMLPMVAMQCNRTVSIVRSGYSDVSGSMQPEDLPIASSLPVFMISRKDKSTSVPGFPAASTTEIAKPEYYVWANTRDISAFQKHDVVIDENANRYEVNVVNSTAFGAQLTCRMMNV